VGIGSASSGSLSEEIASFKQIRETDDDIMPL